MMTTSKYRRAEVRPVIPYRHWQEKMRRDHLITEGKIVMLRHKMPTSDTVGEIRKVRCKVTRIDRFFVTLRFPKGWEQSFLWSDFEEERMPY